MKHGTEHGTRQKQVTAPGNGAVGGAWCSGLPGSVKRSGKAENFIGVSLEFS